MKTTLNIPVKLLDEAQRLSGKKTKTGTIVCALEELVRQNKVREIMNSAGTLDFDDWEETRHAR